MSNIYLYDTIWSNFMRSDIGIKLCHFFVFTLHTRVRPIKVEILNRFLRMADHGLLTVLIKKNWRRLILGYVFYCLKLRFVARKGARSRQNVNACVYGSCACVRAQIFTKKHLVVTSYLMSLSFKFCKDPSFRWGDIPLFVTMYDYELKLLLFSKTKTPRNLRQ